MRLLKTAVLFLLFYSMFSLPAITTAQDYSSNNPGFVRKFNKGLIIKKNRRRHNGRRLVFTDETLMFKDKKSSKSMTIPLDEIQYVRAQVGNRALEGALIGGGLFLLTALAAVAEVEADPYTEVTNAGEVIMITTAIGFGGGLIIGAMIPKEKIVYRKGRFLVDALSPPEYVNPVPAKEYPLIGMQLNF